MTFTFVAVIEWGFLSLCGLISAFPCSICKMLPLSQAFYALAHWMRISLRVCTFYHAGCCGDKEMTFKALLFPSCGSDCIKGLDSLSPQLLKYFKSNQWILKDVSISAGLGKRGA